MSPKESFTLLGGVENELVLSARPRELSSSNVYVTLVDVEQHRLLHTWLVCVVPSPPEITKVRSKMMRSREQ